MSTLRLPDQPVLADYQQYVRQMVRERGFDNEDAADVFYRLDLEQAFRDKEVQNKLRTWK